VLAANKMAPPPSQTPVWLEDSDLDSSDNPLSISVSTLNSETDDPLAMSGITLVSNSDPDSDTEEDEHLDSVLDALWADLVAKDAANMDTSGQPDLWDTFLDLGLHEYLEVMSPAHIAMVIELNRSVIDWERIAVLSNEITGEELTAEEVREEFDRDTEVLRWVVG
jgi:hypothetical protein